MNPRSNALGAVARAVVVIGLVGAACLERPVGTEDPSLTSIFIDEVHNQAVDKLDFLFMIDNSASMGDKQALLAQAVPDLISRLVQPNCVDPAGKYLAVSDANGQCAGGRPEFPPVHDMHIGIVTSSLGGRGSTQCPSDATNDADPTLNGHNDDRGELINRGGPTETPVSNAEPFHFLAWYPVQSNKSNIAPAAPPVPPETAVGALGQLGTLIGDFTSMIQGVHEHGCGFEAQNEAWYRFLVQPDPFAANDGIAIDKNGRASLVGIDSTILAQRRAFLRPDSLLTVIVVTDENEEVANPMSIGADGWMYEQTPFPNSPTYGAPEGTIECKGAAGPMSGPNDPNCTSCAYSNIQSASNFNLRCPNDLPNGMQGFLSAENDASNVRFYNQKARFGVFAGYPISRYIRGLTSPSVPDRTHEVDVNGNYVGDQDRYANCVNPIFAQDLPTDPNADLCHLTRGPRTPDLVYYAAIAGVPHQLLQSQAGVDMECPAGTPQADCPQKNQLTELEWEAITGKDPEHYDFSGIDPHMLESEDPRPGLSCSPSSNDNCDPINGREWATAKGDLQFACIFELVDATTGTRAPKDCALQKYTNACDCLDTGAVNPRAKPLCQKDASGKYTATQIFGKAYPSIREMAIAHAMAKVGQGQGIVSSLCPIHTSTMGNGADPLYGYRPAVDAIVNRLKSVLGGQCLPQKLPVGTDGKVPCLVLVTLPKAGGQDVCATLPGFSAPPQDIIALFRHSRKVAWVQAGGDQSGEPDPDQFPVCTLTQLTNTLQTNAADFGPDGTCSASPDSGWCYVEGQAGSCPQQILFTDRQPPPGAKADLQCFEQAGGAIGGVN